MSNPLLDELTSLSLNRVVYVTLPTMGFFYDEDAVTEDFNPENIPVRPLTILEENSVQDPLLIISGRATDSIIKKLVPTIKDTGKIASIDVQAILIASRIATRGEGYKVSLKCPKCDEKEAEFPVEVNLVSQLARMKPLTKEDLPRFRMETNGFVVNMRPPLFEIVIEYAIALANLSATEIERMGSEIINKDFIERYSEITSDTQESNLRLLAGFIRKIKSPSGITVTENEYIIEWLKNLPAVMMDDVKEKVEEINDWINEMSIIEVECPNKHKSSINLTLDPESLFSPAGYSTPKNTPAKKRNTGAKEKKSSKA